MAKRKTNPRGKRTSEKVALTVQRLASDGVVVYRDLVAIQARKRKGAATIYTHDYNTRGANVIGLADGSILIPRDGPRLWGTL